MEQLQSSTAMKVIKSRTKMISRDLKRRLNSAVFLSLIYASIRHHEFFHVP